MFEADGNEMLMRRVAEINAIAKLEAMSQTTEFTQAAAQAAKVPLHVAEDLVSNPVSTISSVPKGIWASKTKLSRNVPGTGIALESGELIREQVLPGHAPQRTEVLRIGTGVNGADRYHETHAVGRGDFAAAPRRAARAMRFCAATRVALPAVIVSSRR